MTPRGRSSMIASWSNTLFTKLAAPTRGLLQSRDHRWGLGSPAAWPAEPRTWMTSEGTSMRKLILMMSVSLDAFIEGPDRQLDWHVVDDELHGHFNEQLSAMGAFLNGRVTHELMAGFWPTADTDPSSTGPMVEFARSWRDMPKIVFSKTLQRADWNTTVVGGLVVEEVMELKAQPGGDLVLGGA